MEAKLDHVCHGWALLSMRVPQLRRLAAHRRNIAELCKCYSLAMLHLRLLRKSNREHDRISEYEEIVAGIEDEAFYWLKMAVRRSA